MESKSCTGSVGGWVVARGTEEVEAQQQRERERRWLLPRRKIKGESSGTLSREREGERGACGGYKEKEEQGLKLQEEERERVVRIGDLQINKTSRLPETLSQTEGHQIRLE